MKPYAVLILVLLVASCVTLRLGGPCQSGEATCSSAFSALVCANGKAETFSCSGPKGCMVDADKTVRCDQSEGARAGTPCLSTYEGLAHCEGGMPSPGYVQCKGGLWVGTSCTPGSACQDNGGVACVANTG